MGLLPLPLLGLMAAEIFCFLFLFSCLPSSLTWSAAKETSNGKYLCGWYRCSCCCGRQWARRSFEFDAAPRLFIVFSRWGR